VGDVGRLDGGGLLAAALDATPAYVRAGVGRLLPGTGAGTGPDARGEEWSRERLFAALAELLAAVAARSGRGAGLVVEDVHWADSATLDCLTYLARGARHGGVRVVATCRSDEAPVAAHVTGWLAEMPGAAGGAQIRLGPLSRGAGAQQGAALAGGPGPDGGAARPSAPAGGNPVF